MSFKKMPKRLCPFENDVCRQLKIHISQKEVDTNSKENIEKVYSKTIQKLFNGAKFCNDVINSKKDNETKTMIDLTLNSCVKCTINENLGKCWYCDKIYCCNCRFKCYVCQEDFCNSCSVIRYMDNMDSYVCLNCC